MSAGIGIEQEAAPLTIKRRLQSSPSHAVLRERIKQHYENLERLAVDLRALGMDDREVHQNVFQMFHAYETKLSNYINSV